MAGMALAGLLLAPASVLAAEQTITFASDATWTVTDGNAGIGPDLSLPGGAQLVCLNDSFPDPCPAGATKYGYGGGGWGADLASIPGAAWIWAPGVTGETSPANQDVYEFAKTVNIPGTPTGGSISVAVDDGATVWVNGTNVGSSSSQALLTVIDISANLVTGANTIVVRAQNGAICAGDCPYSANPAGVVFGGSITYEPSAVSPEPSAIPTLPPTDTTAPLAGDGGTGSALAVVVGLFALVSLVVVGLRPRSRAVATVIRRHED